MENNIQRKEMLYRAIKRSKPDWLDNGKPTSAMFKDEKGNSVDRGAERTLDEIVQFMKNGVFSKRLKGIGSINAGECIDIGTRVEAAATMTNPYHANIIISKDEFLGNLQALMLADLCNIVYENPFMHWVCLT